MEQNAPFRKRAALLYVRRGALSAASVARALGSHIVLGSGGGADGELARVDRVRSWSLEARRWRSGRNRPTTRANRRAASIRRWISTIWQPECAPCGSASTRWMPPMRSANGASWNRARQRPLDTFPPTCWDFTRFRTGLRMRLLGTGPNQSTQQSRKPERRSGGPTPSPPKAPPPVPSRPGTGRSQRGGVTGHD